MTHQERLARFGNFAYVPAPTKDNPEGIKITDDWAKDNIVTIALPWDGKKMQCHKLAADQFKALWADWEQAKLLDRVLAFNGGWVARYKRGRTGTSDNLSNHAWGTAQDLNAKWNGLGRIPAEMGTTGCLLELVPFAEKHDIVWGGNFRGRVDGMHFEIGIRD